jgi:hypothetical protein
VVSIFAIGSADIWANLLAAVVTVLLIDRISLASEKTKFKPSKEYAESRIMSICLSIISSMAPPFGWKTKLEAPGEIWDDYYDTLLKERDQAVEKLEKTLVLYSNLFDSKLLNQVCELLKMLTDHSWSHLEINLGPGFRDGNCRAFQLDSLKGISNLTDNVMSHSIQILENNKIADKDRLDDLKRIRSESLKFNEAIVVLIKLLPQ